MRLQRADQPLPRDTTEHQLLAVVNDLNSEFELLSGFGRTQKVDVRADSDEQSLIGQDPLHALPGDDVDH